MGGYHKADYKLSFSVPLDFIRCNFNISTQGSIQRIPGMINDEKVPISRNWYQLAGRLDSNISKKIDFTIRYHFRYTQNDYNGKFGSVQNNFFTHRASAQLRWILPADFTFTGGFVFDQDVSTIGLYSAKSKKSTPTSVSPCLTRNRKYDRITAKVKLPIRRRR